MAKPTEKKWMEAVKYGTTDVVRAGIAAGRDVNAKDKDGNTPLGMAALFGNLEVAQLLIESGADVNQVYGSRNTPLIAAANSGEAKVVELLLKHGADVHAFEKSSGALSEAVGGDTVGHLKAARLLIAAGADVNEAMVRAALNSLYKGFIPELAKNGADVNRVDSWWGTPLHIAIESDNDRGVGELLACGADATIRAPEDKEKKSDWAGLTPIEFARKKKKKKIVALLEGTGGKTPASGKSPQPAAKSPKAPTIIKSWERIEQALQPKARQSLPKGATAGQLQTLEKKIRATTTQEVKDFWGRHDGQAAGPPLIPKTYSPAPEFRLLSIKEALAERAIWCELEEGGDFADLEADPDDGVKPDWWNAKWLPIASDTLGNFLCLDFAPGKGGKKAQVIRVDHDNGQRPIVADSVRTLLAEIAAELA